MWAIFIFSGLRTVSVWSCGLLGGREGGREERRETRREEERKWRGVERRERKEEGDGRRAFRAQEARAFFFLPETFLGNQGRRRVSGVS